MNDSYIDNVISRLYKFKKDLYKIADNRNGICKSCNNSTCKRNKNTNRKECNIFFKKEDTK